MGIQTVKYKPHPLAKIFPETDADTKRKLADDIRKNGLQDPIVTFCGLVLDGRTRQEACVMAGVEPRYIAFENLNGSTQEAGPLAYVMSHNLHRRHLTASQRAAVAADSLPFFEAEAKKRQGTRTDLKTTSAPNGAEVVRASAAAAKTTGASPRMVQRAKRLKETSPAKFEQTKAGKITLSKAEQTEAAKQHLEAAYCRIEQICGQEFAGAVRHKARLKNPQDVLAFADQLDGEMKAQQGLIELDWPLRRAQLFRTKRLTLRHTLQEATYRAASNGFSLSIDIDGWHFEVSRTKK